MPKHRVQLTLNGSCGATVLVTPEVAVKKAFRSLRGRCGVALVLGEWANHTHRSTALEGGVFPATRKRPQILGLAPRPPNLDRTQVFGGVWCKYGCW